jgi:photosystem II stability/assembly factor-like uncharacterized protein
MSMKKIYLIILATAASLSVAAFFLFRSGGLISVRIAQKELKEELQEERANILELQKYFDGIHIPFGQKKSPAPTGYLMAEYQKVKQAQGKFKMFSPDTVEWIQRGPANVGGRTRGLIVDPDDPTHHTWFAGSATGGMWKSTDAGVHWTCLSNDIPYQATTTLAMANSNHQVIYMGSGESFPGSMYTTGGGVFRSDDKGVTWHHLGFTSENEDFRWVNRIEVDPDNDSIVIVATNKGIFKSIDAGEHWEQKFSSTFPVEDLVADSSNFNNMFAGVNATGIYRSLDAGETWDKSSTGLGGGLDRIELAISPSNPQKVYASINLVSGLSQLYSSWDHGDHWQLVVHSEVNNYDFLGGQGSYDNTISVSPYNENSVFWGGVNLWKVQVSSTTLPGDPMVTAFDQINTQSFLDFVPFTGNLYPGMSTGDQEDAYDLVESDWVSVEIRFGPGMSQKAHRFWVPANATSGVAYTSYTYKDYVDVPFEVWDVTNNRQLMCSFRDQERDGSFNLYERTGDNYGELGREYLFINSVPYNATTPDPNITVTGGRSYKLIYFFWPTLVAGGTWEPENLPDSKIRVEWSVLQERVGNIENVSDAYGAYGGINGYDQSAGMGNTEIPGFHPDQHELYMIPINQGTGDFWVLNSNDGGMGISYDKGVHFTQIKRNYVTTQFYGVAKKPYRNEYIGGMQDNGTWQSPINYEAGLDSGYNFRIGGDGFETIWNYQDSNRLMGAVYYNSIRRSVNHGKTWVSASGGITTDDGPFVTKLTPVPSNNNVVFALGTNGVYKTGNFASTDWKLTSIGTGWVASGYSVTSSHNVKVSPANEQIVWAGAAMIQSYGWRMFVSTNQGTSFTAVNDPTNPVTAFMSGFAVHPTDENTAYALYSIYDEPKILRTTDLGDTWEDITQVGVDGTSANGFPNVGCLSLMVFPDSTDRIWAGTEIGIMESLDNGESWHYLESELPAVAIWQIFMQDNQVVVATYGRGIWTYQYGPELQPPPVGANELNQPVRLLNVYPNPTTGLVKIDLPEEMIHSDCLIRIYTLNGKQVWSTTAKSSGTSTRSIDLSSINNGTYLISVTSGDINYTGKIIKN